MRPFEPEVEAALLAVLRKIRVWPCFIDSKRKIGMLGTRVRGYWESKANCTKLKNPVESQESFNICHPRLSIGESKQITRTELAYL